MQKKGKQPNAQNHNESYSDLSHLVKKDILGVGVTDATKEDILEFIIKTSKNSSKPYYIVTPNPEMIVLASKNPEFKKVLTNAKIASNDGVGIGLAARLLGISLTKRFTGVDLVENLCEKLSNQPITVGFLGGGPEIAEKASERLRKKYPGLNVSFIGQEWPESSLNKKEVLRSKYQVLSENQQEKKILNTKYLIHNTKVDVLFVAFGAPKQELWMASHVGKIPVTVMIGVGGAFDYISGNVPRAPKIVRQIGFEWLFRLIVQPWRLKRQLALVAFMWMVIKAKLFS